MNRTVSLTWDLDAAEAVAEVFEQASRLAFGRVDKGWADDAKSIRDQLAKHDAEMLERAQGPGIRIVVELR